MSLDAIADKLISKTHVKEDELQSIIHPEIRFRYNSVNVLIGQRGSGKTHYVMKEVVKLSLLQARDGTQNGREESKPLYSQLYYSSDKAFDDTFEKMRKIIKPNIKVHKVTHGETAELINVLSKTKALISEEGIFDSRGIAALSSAEDSEFISDALEVPCDSEIDKPHTIILIDDCLNLFNSKHSELYKRLFENRQPRITFFLALQDVSGIPPSLKSNMDSLVLFGGFPRHKFNVLFYQISVSVDRKSLYDAYAQLEKNEYFVFDFIDGTIV